jgi:hypothetical protein
MITGKRILCGVEKYPGLHHISFIHNTIHSQHTNTHNSQSSLHTFIRHDEQENPFALESTEGVPAHVIPVIAFLIFP